jgi:hypothetical protein
VESLEALTVRDMFQVDFDPLNIDTREIQELSASLPSNGQIDINQAEILAVRFLRGADVCGDLLSIATCHLSKCETEKKRAYSQAALVKASASGHKTDKAKAWFAECDQDYIDAANKHSEALAFVKLIASKHESFIRAHYSAKKLLDRYYGHEKTASFIGSNEKLAQEEALNEPEEQGPSDDFGKDW